MSLQPERPMLDALRDTLRKVEERGALQTADNLELKRLLKRRIAQLEAAEDKGLTLVKP